MSGVLIVGAGLAGSLAALALRAARPGLPVTLLDAAPGPSDRHTWSFHHPDLTPVWRDLMTPGLRASWSLQEVRFPDHGRVLEAGYASLDGHGLAQLVAASGATVLWGRTAAAVEANAVTLSGGTRMTADAVLDARGLREGPHLVAGYQKFVGVEYEMDAPHGVICPRIMDATVPQLDGYRFVYLLPFSPTRLLIEDTRYSDGAGLAEPDLVAAITDYAAAQGWPGREVRRERGVLPIALAHDAAGFWAAQDGAVPIGLRAGLFHPVTGYSLPVAVQVADVIAAADPTTAAIRAAVRDFALRKAHGDRFLRLLNRMLFRGCAPDQRRRVLSRFYRLPEPLIERFYAGRLTTLDKLRIVTGKPPIPIRDALPCLPESPLLKDAR